MARTLIDFEYEYDKIFICKQTALIYAEIETYAAKVDLAFLKLIKLYK